MIVVIKKAKNVPRATPETFRFSSLTKYILKIIFKRLDVKTNKLDIDVLCIPK